MPEAKLIANGMIHLQEPSFEAFDIFGFQWPTD